MASTVTSAGPRTSIRVRAALAGGLVFGIAAGLTVASWTDAEYATTTFTASRFDVETSVNGAAYSNTSPTSISVSGVYPGSTGGAYVQMLVRTTTPSVAGTVRLSHASFIAATGLASVLRYRVVQTAATCNAAAFSAGATYLVGGSAFTSSVPVTTSLPATTAVSVPANSGAGTGYCLEFSLPASGVTQATFAGVSSVAMTWTIAGST